MVSCFLCEQVFQNVDFLAIHFKVLHNLTSSSTFFCVHCSHHFQGLKPFKKHFKNSHSCISHSVNSLISNSSLNTTNETINTQSISQAEFPSETIFSANFFENIVLQFLTKLHSKSNFTRKDIEILVNDLTELLFLPIATFLENDLLNNKKDDNIENIRELLSFLKDPFYKFKTFYKLLKALKDKDAWQDAKEFEIDNRVQPLLSKNEIVFMEKQSKGTIMPINFQIKKFFELPNVLKDTLCNTYKSEEKLSSIVNGALWKEKIKLFPNKDVIPYIIYFDDFEINNPLGSHKGDQSVAAFYYTFPSIPEHHLSSLENIFPALFFKSRYKSYGNEASLKLLVEEIKDLEENGICIKVNGTEKRYFFLLLLITGDNLGLNSVLGFTKSVSSIFYCRRCLYNKTECSYVVRESEDKLRTELNYMQGLHLNETYEKRIKLSGISEDSIFNSISSFHVIQNMYGDIMHDVFEGICHYDICKILLHFIETEKCLDIATLNARKCIFQYGETEIGNISPSINIYHLKRNKLSMSAREMWTFCHFLPLMIGDLISTDSKHWQLLCLLIQILDLLLRTEFDDNILNRMQKKIEEHHRLYIDLFGPTLKPKFHFLIHYPNFIKNVGPLKNLWCFKFESKHRELKIYMNSITSRKNTTVSIATKCLLKFSNRILLEKGFEDKYTTGFVNNGTILSKTYFRNASNVSNIEFLSQNISVNTTYNFTDRITIKSTFYKVSYFLLSKALDIFEIKDIILLGDFEVGFVCIKHKIESFSDHFQSYLVSLKESSFTILHPSEFYKSPLHINRSPNENLYIRPKFY